MRLPNLFGAILESFPEGLAVFNEARRLVFGNWAFATLVDLPPAQLPGKHLQDVLPPLGRQPEWPRIPRRFPVLRRGRTQTLELTAYPLSVAAGAHAVRLRDISGDIEVERMQAEFIETMMRDLRAPTLGVLASAEQIGRSGNGSLTPDQRRQVHQVEVAGVRMLRLIEKLLRVARLSRTRHPAQDPEQSS